MLVLAGGMFAESQETDDGASVSNGMDNEEEAASPAAGKGAVLSSTMRRKGLSTPPATPGTSRGGMLPFVPIGPAAVLDSILQSPRQHLCTGPQPIRLIKLSILTCTILCDSKPSTNLQTLIHSTLFSNLQVLDLLAL